MKMIILERSAGGQIAINPCLVRKLTVNARDESHTIVSFDKEDWISVHGYLEAVAEVIQNASS